jgi:protein TonB
VTESGYLSTSNRYPVSLGLAVALTGAGLTVLLLVEPIVQQILPEVPLVTKEIAISMAPPPKAIKPLETPKPVLLKPTQHTPDFSHPMPDSQVGTSVGKTDFEGLGMGNIDVGPVVPIRPTEPVLVDASADPRFSKDMQPPYPSSLQRLEIEGTATVRVQIDVDGRVLRVESVAADNEGFLTTTRVWALRHWRFKPATRDGQAITSWKTIRVQFRMDR